ncbi:Holliday junction resolvase RuvX [Jiella endophytica]|uniref:Putative pre-16S rRNA nuclease n=1 Tax=Jiella endophytica TaxID=2558362 RepID=A0A4Y8RT68_9HYPH|nr:Holliday junction resolvase RuvX [Jiella endophytica]TFF27495.1 Holliday junction resolvase RuvX [Jiella endophytica]
MAVLALEEFLGAVPAGLPLAGLDLGTKTIGLALSDRSWRFATPRPVLRRKKFTPDAAALKKALDDEQVVGIVIGLPLNMDGSEGPRAQATRAFMRNYSALDARPAMFWDERLSTVAVERAMIEADVSRARRAERIDSAAAAFILQGALDRLAAMPR